MHQIALIVAGRAFIVGILAVPSITEIGPAVVFAVPSEVVDRAPRREVGPEVAVEQQLRPTDMRLSVEEIR
jgi:hypothetical protein